MILDKYDQLKTEVAEKRVFIDPNNEKIEIERQLEEKLEVSIRLEEEKY